MIREPWDDRDLATFVRLCAWLSDRWARDRLTAEEACSATLSRHDLAVITGRAQLVHSRRALRALCEHVSCTLSERGTYTDVEWPKFAEFQDLPGRIAREAPLSAPAPAPAPAPATKKRKKTEKKASQDALFHQSEPRRLSELLRSYITVAYPSQEVPPLRKWDAEIAKIQNANPDEIEKVIHWLFSDDNGPAYKFKVLNARQLRLKYASILEQIERKKNESNGRARPRGGADSRDDAFRELGKEHQGRVAR